MTFWAKAIAGAVLAAALSIAGRAEAQPCGSDGAGFERWLGQFRADAARQGISQPTLAAALQSVSYDSSVIRLDRGQKSFKLSFEEFYARRVSDSLINRGRRLMQQHAGLLDRIEKRFGVPGAVLLSIWGLETNYGSDGGGKHYIVQSIATLAYDCRRSEFFRGHLIDALKIIDRGDITAAQMRGGWAGEIGPMQFLPGSYSKFAVDFDGDGRRDLFRSVPDFLASTANFLKGNGWQAGQPWTPGTANWEALKTWNKAEVYQKTIAVMAARLADRGAEPPAAQKAPTRKRPPSDRRVEQVR